MWGRPQRPAQAKHHRKRLTCVLRMLAASVAQMLCGSLIVFAALLSSIFLKRRLNRWLHAGCGMQLESCIALMLPITCLRSSPPILL